MDPKRKNQVAITACLMTIEIIFGALLLAMEQYSLSSAFFVMALLIGVIDGKDDLIALQRNIIDLQDKTIDLLRAEATHFSEPRVDEEKKKKK